MICKFIRFKIIKCVIVASPGFLKEQFLTYLTERTEKDVSKMVTENRSKFMLVHASNGFKHALKEVLADPTIASTLSETKVECLTKFDLKYFWPLSIQLIQFSLSFFIL